VDKFGMKAHFGYFIKKLSTVSAFMHRKRNFSNQSAEFAVRGADKGLKIRDNRRLSLITLETSYETHLPTL
jgi:hypothetical protein